MAIIFRGKTPCAICSRPLLRADEVVSFPAFLGPGHPLHEFSDSAMHRDCFQRWDRRLELEALYSKYRVIWEQRPRDLKTLEEIEEWGREALKEFH